LVLLRGVGKKVDAQLQSNSINEDNPLGRILKVYEDNKNLDVESLEIKVSEAIVHERPDLERGHTLLKIIAAIAPLMGLLGTVTGMILTFQGIVIFGAGDPKAMAGGISQALVTTVLGLMVAIPTVLLHTLVSGRSNAILHILEEQALGVIARRASGGSR
jgi:biopolymer transport protein ExbB